MSPTPLPDGTPCAWPRPAALVNEEIRALWQRAPLSPADEDLYRSLLVEWAAAVRGGATRDDVRPAA